MKDYKYGLFIKRRFAPIFLAQFLGAFNDNLLRSGLVVMIAYAKVKGISLPVQNEAVLVTICSALLVVPFIIFSFIAGQLADKYEKARLVTFTKIAEIGIMCGAYYGFATHNIYLLMALLFVSGTHSTFFGPIKYSILPDHLRKGELLAGNGFVSGGTYLGILFGLIAGGLLIEMENNAIGMAAVCVATIGFIASLFIPRTKPAEPHMKLDFHIVRGTLDIVKQARSSPSLFHSILGLSWFLMFGSIYMSQFPNYAQSVIHGNNEVYTLFLAVFSIGIAFGSVICDKLLKGQISAKLAPWALLGISVFTCAMVFTTPHPTHDGLLTVREFLRDVKHWPVLASMLLVAVCGGIYMVPLYALLQSKSAAGQRSRVIAASNLFDSMFMTGAAIVCAGLLAGGLPITHLFLVAAAFNLFVFYLARKAAAAHARTH